MKRFSICGLLAVVVSILAGCTQAPTIDLKECDAFVAAKPVWAQGRETERNLTLAFREVINTGRIGEAYMRLTASCNYRLINDEYTVELPLKRGKQRVWVPTAKGGASPTPRLSGAKPPSPHFSTAQILKNAR